MHLISIVLLGGIFGGLGSAAFPSETNNVLNLTFEIHFSPENKEEKHDKSWLDPNWFTQPTKSYDFVIDIPDTLTTINNPGWGVYVAPEAMNFLSDAKKSTTLSIIGVMGYYSKGKSFIVNELYNAGVQLGKMSYNEKLLTARTEAGVTTKGISGVFSGYSGGFIDTAELLVLDCAGRNAPARAWSNGDDSSIDQLRRGIEELRSKERLVDDVIIATADSIIYVLDEVLNEDQRAIIHIIDEIFQSRSRTELIIIHNMKRIDCQSKSIVESLTNEMIRDAFHAQEFKSVGIMNSLPRTQWRSSWLNKINKKPFYIYHYVIFDHDKCKKENKATFAIIADRKFRQTETKFIRELSPLNHLIDQIGSRIVHYVEPTDDNILYSDGSSFHMLGDQTYNSRIIAKNADKKLKLKQWQMWEMPSTTSGEYVPNYETYHDWTNHFFKVELPGISSSNIIKGNTPSPINESWVRVKEDVPSEADKSFQFKKLVVEGYRFVDRDRFPSTKAHGYFLIETYVSLYFSHPTIELAHGMLVITYSHSNQDLVYRASLPGNQRYADVLTLTMILIAVFVVAGTMWLRFKLGLPAPSNDSTVGSSPNVDRPVSSPEVYPQPVFSPEVVYPILGNDDEPVDIEPN